jgi:hypothetical protein
MTLNSRWRQGPGDRGAEGCELFGGLCVFVIERMFYWVGEAS